MRKTNWTGLLALAVGLGLAGASAVSAEERRGDWRDGGWGYRQDLRGDYRDLHVDHERAERLRAEIARDRWRLDEDLRCGRDGAARRDAAELARDERELRALGRDMYRDRRDVERDQYRNGWRDDRRRW